MYISYKILTIIAINLLSLNCAKGQDTKEDMDGWFKAGSKPGFYEIGITDERYNDKTVYYIKSTENVENGFGTIMKQIPSGEYSGKRVMLSGYIKNEKVDNKAGMWMRIDGNAQGLMLGFDNMSDRPINGTTDWGKYEIVLDVPDSSVNIAYGVLLSGNGNVWLSALSFEVVGNDITTTDMLKDKPKGVDGWFLMGSKYDSYEIGASEEKHNNNSVYYIKSIKPVTEGFGTISKRMPPGDYTGERVRLTGNIKTADIDGYVGMWMRVDGPETHETGKSLSFDNMNNRPIKGTNDWKKYEIVLDVPGSSIEIFYGVLVSGNGQVWISDLSFETVGNDVPATDMLKQ